MHGTTMVFLVGMPHRRRVRQLPHPVDDRRRDVAFPRLNMFGYWVFAFGGIFLYSSFVFGGAPDGGWFGYAPLTSTPLANGYLPGRGRRLLGRRLDHARHRVGRDRGQLHRDRSSTCARPA